MGLNLGGILKGALGLVPGIGTAVSVGSGILGAVTGAKKGSQANKQSQQALDMALGRHKELSPLRTRALDLSMRKQPQRENLDSLFADPGNPYARTISRPQQPMMLEGMLGQRPAAPPVAQQPMAPPVPGGKGVLRKALS